MHKLLALSTITGFLFLILSITSIAYENNYKDEKILRSPSLLKAINLAKKMIKGEGRVLIRKSGTEAKIRIMAESENFDLIKKCIHIVKKEIK